MKTQVGIVGAGPAGLMLAQMLHLEGIHSVIVETKSREYIEQRVRAGVLEHGIVKMMIDAGVGARMQKEGLPHDGIQFLFRGELRRVNFHELVGKRVTVYGQQEAVKDLVAARLATGQPLIFEAENTAVHDIESAAPSISYTDAAGKQHKIECDFIAGCDGFHGISRPAIPAHLLRGCDRVYPYAWLGVLTESKPASEELIYSLHDRGFALMSMRSPTISRMYLQCAVDEDLANWPDDRIWEELTTRLDFGGSFRLEQGPILQKGITPMRSFVAEPMQHGRLFLAGDSAHIVPPTGAKGMNLALADVRVLTRALRAFFRSGDESLLKTYTSTCLRHVWLAEYFSWFMTTMLHKDEGPWQNFDQRRQFAELELMTTSRDAGRMLAENYSDACSAFE